MANAKRDDEPQAGCIYTIRSRYADFSAKERAIADHILENPAEAVHPSIDQLAETIGISESTLVRFVRKLGYTGYQRFRIALATETVTPTSRVYEMDIDAMEDPFELIFANAMNTLTLTKRVLDRHAIGVAGSILSDAKRVLLFGLGGSNIIAQDAFHKFIRIGIDCVVSEDFHLQLMVASQADNDCAAILFSHTGTNMDTLALAEELKQRACKVIVVTTSAKSVLARMADVVLSVAVASTSYVSEAFTARIAQLMVVDLLYVDVVRRKGETALRHMDTMRRAIAKRKT